MKIAVGCDHIALGLKETLLEYLAEQGHQLHDFGTYTPERTHYPLYAEKVARAVAAGEFERGLLLCGTGAGMAIAANKVNGIRAVNCSDIYTAVLSRRHNDSNILTIGSMVVGPGLAKMIVDGWLEGQYDGGRHQARVDMIARLEKGSLDN